MKRLAAMQLCPLFWQRLVAATFGGLVEVGRRHDDERVAAAELEHRLLQLLAGDRGHRLPGRGRAGERGGDDPVVAQHRLDVLAADEQGEEDVVREARPAEQLLHVQRRLRHVARVLEQARRCRPSAPGAAKRIACQSGKFHGMIASTGPSGW